MNNFVPRSGTSAKGLPGNNHSNHGQPHPYGRGSDSTIRCVKPRFGAATVRERLARLLR